MRTKPTLYSILCKTEHRSTRILSSRCWQLDVQSPGIFCWNYMSIWYLNRSTKFVLLNMLLRAISLVFLTVWPNIWRPWTTNHFNFVNDISKVCSVGFLSLISQYKELLIVWWYVCSVHNSSNLVCISIETGSWPLESNDVVFTHCKSLIPCIQTTNVPSFINMTCNRRNPSDLVLQCTRTKCIA